MYEGVSLQGLPVWCKRLQPLKSLANLVGFAVTMMWSFMHTSPQCAMITPVPSVHAGCDSTPGSV